MGSSTSDALGLHPNGHKFASLSEPLEAS